MVCKFDLKLIHDYAENDISELEKIFVEEHLKYCSKCQKELNFIKDINKGFKEVFDKINIPDRLGIISELIIENGMAGLDNNNEFKIKEVIKNYQSTMRTSTELSRIHERNPYSMFMKKSINHSVKYVKNPVEKYIKKKVSSIKLFDFIKIG